MEEKINPGELESDKDRLLLIQEKEQLVRELRSVNPRSKSRSEMEQNRLQIEKLEHDLNVALETSNRCIADRLQIHETKQRLLQQLTDAMRAMAQLESQLKLLSASTLSMSSSSSLGSLSSSHASSKGSLSSLSFTDIYGLSTTTPAEPSLLDLHKRVDKFLQGGQQQPNSSLSGKQKSFPGTHTILTLAFRIDFTSFFHLQIIRRKSLANLKPAIPPAGSPCHRRN